jgi:hypothetical protein
MGYHWEFGYDNVRQVTAAAGGLSWVGVIQRNDGYGGFNVSFAVANSAVRYHVHFKRGSKKVNAVRYKASSNDNGRNIVVYRDDQGGSPSGRKNLHHLADHCNNSRPRFYNHAYLLEALYVACEGHNF